MLLPSCSDICFLDRVNRLARLAVATLGVCLFVPHIAQAQGADGERRWRAALELGATPSTTWLDGTGAPEITSGVGAHFAAGVQRGLTARIAGGVMLRFHQTSLEITENGDTWSGGPIREFDAMAMASVEPKAQGALRFSIDAGVGIQQLHAPGNTLPFSDASSILPVGELGASLRHGNASGPVSRSEFVLFARYSARLLRVNRTDALAEGGTIARMIIGVGVVR